MAHILLDRYPLCVAGKDQLPSQSEARTFAVRCFHCRNPMCTAQHGFIHQCLNFYSQALYTRGKYRLNLRFPDLRFSVFYYFLHCLELACIQTILCVTSTYRNIHRHSHTMLLHAVHVIYHSAHASESSTSVTPPSPFWLPESPPSPPPCFLTPPSSSWLPVAASLSP